MSSYLCFLSQEELKVVAIHELKYQNNYKAIGNKSKLILNCCLLLIKSIKVDTSLL